MKKIIKVSILLVLLTVMLVSSCLLCFAEEKVITFARPENIIRLDPYNNHDASSSIVNKLIYDSLVGINPETGVDFIPELATEWSISDDGTEYTFKLRQGVKFHNGEPFNAECVKVSIDRFLNEKLDRDTEWLDLKEVEVVDDYTVIIRLTKPNVICLVTITTTPMFPAVAFKEKGVALFDNPVGTGAFTFSEWKRGQYFSCEKNPDYWGKPAYIDKFIYRPIIEGGTRLAAVLTGEIDIADVMPADQIPTVEASPDVGVVRIPASDQNYIGLRNIAPMTDKKFRQAINMAIDRESIVKYVLLGGRVSTGLIPKGIFGFDESLTPVKLDIEKAKQLVKESIYDGRELKWIIPMGWYPKMKDITQAVQAQLMEAGINVKLDLLEGGAYKEKRSAGHYDFYITGHEMVDVDNMLQMVIGQDAMSTGYENKELNKLISDQKEEMDRQKREELLRKIQNVSNTEVAPQIFIYQLERIYFERKGLTGAVYYGNGIPDLRYVRYK